MQDKWRRLAQRNGAAGSGQAGRAKHARGWVLVELGYHWTEQSDTTFLFVLLFSEETADWERELQEELQEYDVLADNEHHDDNWDKELEDMLKEQN